MPKRGDVIKASDLGVRDGTLQSNLNADKLDGYSHEDFLKSGGKAVDADLLDGLNSSQFVRSDINASTKTLTVDSNSDIGIVINRTGGYPSIKGGAGSAGHVIIDSSGYASVFTALNYYNSNNVVLAKGGGKVGIGTESPSTTLDVNGYANVIGLSVGSGGLVIDDTSVHLKFKESGVDKWHIESIGSALRFVETGIQTRLNLSPSDIIFNGTSLVNRNNFGTIAVSGQSAVIADSVSDTLTFVGSNGVNITTDATTDTITFAVDTSNMTANNSNTVGGLSASQFLRSDEYDTQTGGITFTNGINLSGGMPASGTATNVEGGMYYSPTLKEFRGHSGTNWGKFWTEHNFNPSSKLDSTANAVSASKFASPITITVDGDASGSVTFDGSSSKTLALTINDNSHEHSYITSNGKQTMTTGTTNAPRSGVSMSEVYSNGYPATHGNLLEMKGNGASGGAGQLLIGWSPTSVTDNGITAGNHADNYIRSKRDVPSSSWSNWAKIWTDANFDPSTKLDKTGGTVTGDLTVNQKINVGASVSLEYTSPALKISTFGDIIMNIDSNNNESGRYFAITNDVNTELFRVGDNGNVGIGTSSPSRKLHVVSNEWDNTSGGGAIFENSHVVGSGITLKPSSSLVEKNGWSIYAGSTSSAIGDGNFGIWEHGATAGLPRMTFARGGNVGIGTTSPTHMLHIKQKDNSDSGFKIEAQDGGYGHIWMGTGGLVIDTDSPHSLHFRTNGTNRMLIANDGKVGIGTPSPSYNLHVYTDTDVYGFAIGTATTRLRFAGTASGATTGYGLIQQDGGSGNLVLQRDSGNVGIGISTPTSKLHVVGGATVSGSITVGNIISNTNNTDYNQISRNATYPALYVDQYGAGDIAEFRTVGQVPKMTIKGDGGINTSGDINITKNQPWVTIRSSGSGSNTVEQSAGISIGESGQGSASLHITYTGDGYGHIGMGTISNAVPTYNAMRFYYQNRDVDFMGKVTVDRIEGVSEIVGDFGSIVKSTDEWLRINDGASHTSGVYFSSSTVRTDGELQVGGSGDKFRVTSGGNVTVAGSVTTNGDLWVGGSDGARMRYVPLTTSYGFTTTHNNAVVITNEQGGVNQAIVLGDSDGANTTFGISRNLASTANGSTGEEAGWQVLLNLKADGQMELGDFSSGSDASSLQFKRPSTSQILDVYSYLDGSGSAYGGFGWQPSTNKFIVSHSVNGELLSVNDIGDLTVNGDLVIPTKSKTVGGSTFNNGWIRLGNGSSGMAIDSNEIVQFGNQLNLSANSPSGSVRLQAGVEVIGEFSSTSISLNKNTNITGDVTISGKVGVNKFSIQYNATEDSLDFIYNG